MRITGFTKEEFNTKVQADFILGMVDYLGGDEINGFSFTIVEINDFNYMGRTSKDSRATDDVVEVIFRVRCNVLEDTKKFETSLVNVADTSIIMNTLKSDGLDKISGIVLPDTLDHSYVCPTCRQNVESMRADDYKQHYRITHA